MGSGVVEVEGSRARREGEGRENWNVPEERDRSILRTRLKHSTRRRFCPGKRSHAELLSRSYLPSPCSLDFWPVGLRDALTAHSRPQPYMRHTRPAAANATNKLAGDAKYRCAPACRRCQRARQQAGAGGASLWEIHNRRGGADNERRQQTATGKHQPAGRPARNEGSVTRPPDSRSSARA